MTFEEVLLLDPEIKFIVNLRKSARAQKNSSLVAILTAKLKSILPAKVLELQMAYANAKNDMSSEEEYLFI